jgi:hypothetical protein
MWRSGRETNRALAYAITGALADAATLTTFVLLGGAACGASCGDGASGDWE